MLAISAKYFATPCKRWFAVADGRRVGICLVSGSHPNLPCGIGDYAAKLGEALVDAGNDVTFVTTAGSWVGSKPTKYRLSPAMPSWSFKELLRLVRAVRDSGAKVVNVQYPARGYRRGLAPALLVMALRLTRYPGSVVLTLHELRRFRFPQNVLIRVAASFADLVITVDAAETGRRFRLPPFLDPEVAEIPIGQNISLSGRMRPPTQPEPHGVDRGITIGTWGFLSADKGIEALLSAFSLAAAQRDMRLVIAGDTGPDELFVGRVRNWIKDANLEARVQFTGWLPEEQLSDVLASFDICVLPFVGGVTRKRTTYVTAVAHGLYVITTSSSRRGYDAATNTMFVAPNDVAGMAAAMLTVRPRLKVIGDIPTWPVIAEAHVRSYEKSLLKRRERR
jgi:glycosyltransferase involved in cell wall biosynthesis